MRDYLAYFIIHFVTRYFVALIAILVLWAWVIFHLAGWSGPVADLTLFATGLTLGLRFRRAALEGERLDKTEIKRRANRLQLPRPASW
jgi:hypothetical protein